MRVLFCLYCNSTIIIIILLFEMQIKNLKIKQKKKVSRTQMNIHEND